MNRINSISSLNMLDIEAERRLKSSLTTDCISYWKLNEASGVRYDSCGNNHLTSVNGVPSTTGINSNAASFSSISQQRLIVADNPSLSLGNFDFTYTGWFFYSALNDTIPYHIFSKDALGDREIGFQITGTTRIPTVAFWDNVGTVVQLGSSVAPINFNQWYFFAIWHDATADTLNIRINATVDSVATGGLFPKDTVQPFIIGADLFIGFETYWRGRIDEFGFWKRKLSTAELDYLQTTANTWPFYTYP